MNTSLISRVSGMLGCLLVLAVIIGTVPAQVQAQTGERCFPETGFCISGRIREYWEANNGLVVFGLPITPQRTETIEGTSRQVQWFQRNRLELHPENAPPFDVLLGLLGADRLRQQSINPDIAFQKANQQPGCRYFPETGHNVCGRMLRQWRAIGLETDGQPGFTEAENLALFGLPLSNEHTTTLSNGQQHTVQWFQRARFEIHVNPAPNQSNSIVLLGLLGDEVLNGPDPDEARPPRAPGSPDVRIAFETNSGINRALFPAADANRVRYIHTMNIFGSQRSVLTRNHVQLDRRPTWSPDGQRIAFESPRDTGLPDIYVMDADGSNIVRLTNHPEADGFPAWSPDGSRIAFASQRTGDWEIFVMNADGSGEAQLTFNPGIQDQHPTWSPDGSRIAYTANGGLNRGEWDIYTIPAGGGSPTNLTNHPSDDQSPDWGPNGRIAFKSLRDGRWQIYTMNGDGSDVRNISNTSDNDEEPAWAPNGQQIAYQTGRFGPGEIFVMNADGSDKRNISDSPAEDGAPAWSPPLPDEPPSPCPYIPEPVNATVSPARCVSTSDEVTINIFGFLANEPFQNRVVAALDNGQILNEIAASGNVDGYGQNNDIRFAPGELAPGDYRFEFIFFFGDGTFYGSTVYMRVSP